jgi:dTMP kinase
MVRFITFEGGDGTGKTTQIRALEASLREQKRSCVISCEPGGTRLGQTIRKILLEVHPQPLATNAELFLYLADRAQHVQEIILPALARGEFVLCDRYTDSTIAYQGYGRGLDLKFLRAQNAIATGGLQPDLTFLLDCASEVALLRAMQRHIGPTGQAAPADRFESEQVEFHQRVRAGFLELAHAEPKRFRVIDATQSPQEIASAIRATIEREAAQ